MSLRLHHDRLLETALGKFESLAGDVLAASEVTVAVDLAAVRKNACTES